MRLVEIVTRASLVAGLSLAGAFGGAVRSEATPPDSGDCRIIQAKGDEVIVVCPYSYRPETDIEQIKKKCIVTGTEIYGHRTLTVARLNTDLQKNCWGPSIKDYIRTVIKNPARIPPRFRR